MKDDLCITCQKEPQTGLIGSYWYRRCHACMTAYDNMRETRRQERLKRFETMMRGSDS